MKKFASTFLLFISLNSYSQVNFFQTGATWGYLSVEHPDTPWDPYRNWLEQFVLTGDTLINNIVYEKLSLHSKETFFSGTGIVTQIINYNYTTQYLRFDSLNNKVFCYSDIDSTEKLIYDFNLTIGDTVPNAIVQGDVIIDSIENTTLFGYPVKKYYITYDTSYFSSSQYIIEGMGGSNGLTFLQLHYLSVSSYIITDLICFQLGNDVYPSGSVCDVFAGIEEKENTSSPVSVYPNPFQNSFYINVSTRFRNNTLTITDIFGRKNYHKLIDNNTVIDDFQMHGIFFWQVFNDGKIIGSGKLIGE